MYDCPAESVPICQWSSEALAWVEVTVPPLPTVTSVPELLLRSCGERLRMEPQLLTVKKTELMFWPTLVMPVCSFTRVTTMELAETSKVACALTASPDASVALYEVE